MKLDHTAPSLTGKHQLAGQLTSDQRHRLQLKQYEWLPFKIAFYISKCQNQKAYFIHIESIIVTNNLFYELWRIVRF